MIKVCLLIFSLLFTLLNIYLITKVNKKFKRNNQEGEKLYKTEFIQSYTLLLIQCILYIISFSFIGKIIFFVLIGFNILFNINVLSNVLEINSSIYKKDDKNKKEKKEKKK